MKFSWHHQSDEKRWEIEQFLRHGTDSFFHEPAFFDYHNKENYRFEHLVCRKNDKLFTWLPGHRNEDVFFSPAGASYGGPLWCKNASLSDQIGSIEALKSHLFKKGIREIHLRLPPAYYFGDNGFVLSSSGFSLKQRWACHALQLVGNEWPESLKKKKRYDYQRSIKEGTVGQELQADSLEAFHHLLTKQMKKRETRPTHDLAELCRLNELLPGRIRLFGALSQNRLVAATLVFQINHKVSYTFYITADDNYLEKCGTLVALVTAATTLRKEKCDWLDLGPSTFDDFKINEGTCRFKESLGAVIFARDSWTYAV